MAHHTPRWRDLLPGILALGLCLTVAVVVLRFARVGALRGETFPLVVLGHSAEDLLQGTEVWLAGQAIGQIERVEFRPPSTDTTHRLAIHILVYERARRLLRDDSHARITAGGSPLGASVLALAPGSPAGGALRDGDTLRMRPAPSLGAMAARLTNAADLEDLRTNLATLGALTAGTRGTVGALLHDSARTRELARFDVAVDGLLKGAGGGRGTIGRFAAEGAVQRRMASALARADSVQRLLASTEGSLGRFRRDSTLLIALDDVRNEIDIIRARVADPRGTIGRLQSDGIIAVQLDSVSAALGALSRDVRRRPFRYLIF